MLALKLTDKTRKFDLHIRNSFASTQITFQAGRSQAKHESYCTVSNDMNLDHSTSFTLLCVWTFK